MDELVLSDDNLRELTEMVKNQLPLPVNGGLTRIKSSAQAKMSDDGILKGAGRSEFVYSSGKVVRVTWRFRLEGIDMIVALDQEEVIENQG